jgi:hypothetical protein
LASQIKAKNTLLIIPKMTQIPPASIDEFKNGITHPLLYLWDAWSYREGNALHLYCLAVSRVKSDGTPLLPHERNNFPFHIRHFISADNGTNWKDEGCFLEPSELLTMADFYTIWSGSVEMLPDNKKLVAFTGLEKVDSKHTFIQNIALGVSKDGYSVDEIQDVTLSSPLRDWEEINKLGYYIDAPEKLGCNDGENDGPILAWRDPFIFIDKSGGINLFWGGKVTSHKGALVRATLEKNGDQYKIAKLYPPVTVPDGDEFTQLELPKIVHDKERDLYYLMISTCKRLYEGQPDSEVDKCVRMYKANTIDGPWESLGNKILGAENLFGPTILEADFENNRLRCIAPYTDAAEDSLSLTFSPLFYVHLDTMRVEFF